MFVELGSRSGLSGCSSFPGREPGEALLGDAHHQVGLHRAAPELLRDLVLGVVAGHLDLDAELLLERVDGVGVDVLVVVVDFERPGLRLLRAGDRFDVVEGGQHRRLLDRPEDELTAAGVAVGVAVAARGERDEQGGDEAERNGGGPGSAGPES